MRHGGEDVVALELEGLEVDGMVGFELRGAGIEGGEEGFGEGQFGHCERS